MVPNPIRIIHNVTISVFQNLQMQMGSKGGEGSRTSSLPVSPLLINAINLDEANRRQ